MESDQAEFRPGDLVNGWVHVGDQWVTPVFRSDVVGAQVVEVGTVVNEHVWTGQDWVPISRREHMPDAKMGFRDRLRNARAEIERQDEEKLRRRAAQGNRKAQDKLAQSEQFGRVIAEGTFAAHSVRIFERGYVSVGLVGSGTPRRLLGISGVDKTQRKNPIGRSAVFVATMGVNYLATPDKRGSAYLIIVTPDKTYTLTSPDPSDGDLKNMIKLEAAGLAVIEAQANASQAQEGFSVGTTTSPDLAGQLSRLHDLHSSGALTDEEFSQAKAQLLAGGSS